MSDAAVPPADLAQLERSLDRLRAVAAEVGTEQLGLPVPSCPEWDVRGLLRHLLVDLEQFVPMTAGEQADFGAEPPELDGTGLRQLDDAAERLRAAWRTAPDLGRTGIQAPELSVHAWDLARATGQEPPADEEVDAASLAFLRTNLRPEYRGTAEQPGSFGPEVSAPAGASALERLVAFSGRRP